MTRAAPGRTNLVVDLQARLSLHLVDLETMAVGRERFTMAPGLSLTMLLSGGEGVSVRLEGETDTALAAPAAAGGGRPELVLMNFVEPHPIERQASSRTGIRHVGFTLPPGWPGGADTADDPVAGAIRRFSRRHLAIRRQPATARSTALAQRLFQAPPYAGLLLQLAMESQAMELLASLLADSFAAPRGRPEHGLTRKAVERLHRVRELIEQPAAAAPHLTLQDLCRQAGMSATQLQERFKALFGMTPFEMARHCRMEHARRALEAGLRVSQAAEIAGYSSQANFSTAFRKRYGVAPKLVR